MDPAAGATDEPPEKAAGSARPVDRRMLDEIFGDVLPETTSDERDDGPDGAAGRYSEQWYRENMPPHHG